MTNGKSKLTSSRGQAGYARRISREARPLREADVASDPLDQFRAWFAEATSAVDVPEAVALATATPDGAPSARMVLLKRADERGFAFVSGYESRKGRELAANPRAALLFYWHPLGRQVRVEGLVERLPPAESDHYFASRPPASRVSAAASPQSEVIPSREALEARVRELAGDVQRPPNWGGFVLVPQTYEFWQHRDDRLHDRLRYRRDGERWVLERLAP
jgi:pyridoxamine 5'-phosphate oxidase